jgi:hypothetical protein
MTSLQRFTANAAIVRFEMDAKGVKALNLNRLGIMGLTRKDADLIGQQFTKHGRNLDKWDPMARHQFATALGRWVGKVANEHDVGQMAAVLGTPMGKLLGQFRTFALASYTNAVLYHGNMRDLTSVGTAIPMIAGGLMAYVGRAYMDSAGMSDQDRQKFLADRLSTEKLVAGTMHGSGLASILPSIADTALYSLGFAAPGSVRSTGIGSAPVLDYANNAFKAAHGLTQPLHGKSLTRADVTNVINMLPFSHTLPGTFITNRLVQGLSKH